MTFFQVVYAQSSHLSNRSSCLIATYALVKSVILPFDSPRKSTWTFSTPPCSASPHYPSKFSNDPLVCGLTQTLVKLIHAPGTFTQCGWYFCGGICVFSPKMPVNMAQSLLHSIWPYVRVICALFTYWSLLPSLLVEAVHFLEAQVFPFPLLDCSCFETAIPQEEEMAETLTGRLQLHFAHSILQSNFGLMKRL